MYNLSKIIIPMVCLFGVVACGSNSDSQEATAKKTKNSQAENAQENVVKSEYVSPLPDNAPTFTVAIEEDDYPPFEYKDEYGQYNGYDFDLIRSVGEEAGFKVSFTPMTFVEVLPSLNSGTSDIVISGMTVTEERVSSYQASKPYIKTASSFIVKKDSEYQNATQLVDKKVAVQKGSFQQKALENDNSNYNAIPVKTNYLVFEAIFSGKAEAGYADKTMLIHLAEQFPEHKINYLPHGEEVTLAIFTKKDNDEVMAKVNEGLRAVKSNGRYQELNKKWFGSSANSVAVE